VRRHHTMRSEHVNCVGSVGAGALRRGTATQALQRMDDVPQMHQYLRCIEAAYWCTLRPELATKRDAYCLVSEVSGGVE